MFWYTGYVGNLSFGPVDDITDKPGKLSIHKQKDGTIHINRVACFASSEDEDSAVFS